MASILPDSLSGVLRLPRSEERVLVPPDLPLRRRSASGATSACFACSKRARVRNVTEHPGKRPFLSLRNYRPSVTTGNLEALAGAIATTQSRRSMSALTIDLGCSSVARLTLDVSKSPLDGEMGGGVRKLDNA